MRDDEGARQFLERLIDDGTPFVIIGCDGKKDIRVFTNEIDSPGEWAAYAGSILGSYSRESDVPLPVFVGYLQSFVASAMDSTKWFTRRGTMTIAHTFEALIKTFSAGVRQGIDSANATTPGLEICQECVGADEPCPKHAEMATDAETEWTTK